MTKDQLQSLGDEFLGNQVIETIIVQSYDEWKNHPRNNDLSPAFEPEDNSVEEIDPLQSIGAIGSECQRTNTYRSLDPDP